MPSRLRLGASGVANGSGIATLDFPAVVPGQVFTVTVSVPNSEASAVWTLQVGQDSGQPLASWLGRTLTGPFQVSDGEILRLVGSGLTAGSTYTAMAVGRADLEGEAPFEVPPSVLSSLSLSQLTAGRLVIGGPSPPEPSIVLDSDNANTIELFNGSALETSPGGITSFDLLPGVGGNRPLVQISSGAYAGTTSDGVIQLYGESDDGTELGRVEIASIFRTPVGNPIVTTLEATGSAVFVDLATPGPSQVMQTGDRALVLIGCRMLSSVAAGQAVMAVAVSGATTIAAADPIIHCKWAVAGDFTRAGQAFLITGLTEGLNTFTAKYRTGGAGNASFADRTLIVIPI